MRKAITGQDYLFEWSAPSPLSADPTLEVTGGAGAYNVTMTQSRSDVTVSSIATDRRTWPLYTSDAADDLIG